MSNLKEKIDNLFSWFEDNKFTNEGNYPRNTNLVFEFCDYVNCISDDDLVDRLGLLSEYKDIDDALEAARNARNIINNGIESWLGA